MGCWRQGNHHKNDQHAHDQQETLRQHSWSLSIGANTNRFRWMDSRWLLWCLEWSERKSAISSMFYSRSFVYPQCRAWTPRIWTNIQHCSPIPRTASKVNIQFSLNGGKENESLVVIPQMHYLKVTHVKSAFLWVHISISIHLHIRCLCLTRQIHLLRTKWQISPSNKSPDRDRLQMNKPLQEWQK